MLEQYVLRWWQSKVLPLLIRPDQLYRVQRQCWQHSTWLLALLKYLLCKLFQSVPDLHLRHELLRSLLQRHELRGVYQQPLSLQRNNWQLWALLDFLPQLPPMQSAVLHSLPSWNVSRNLKSGVCLYWGESGHRALHNSRRLHLRGPGVWWIPDLPQLQLSLLQHHSRQWGLLVPEGKPYQWRMRRGWRLPVPPGPGGRFSAVRVLQHLRRFPAQSELSRPMLVPG